MSEKARDRELAAAVESALDELLGPNPTDLVEERGEERAPEDDNEAQAHRYRAPANFYNLG